MASANDSAASLAAGGIELIRQEQIAMEKEDLFISTGKVTVAYEFRNLSDQDITTEIAFPIPAFGYEAKYYRHGYFIDDFKVYVNGDPVPYEKEIKAVVGDREVDAILNEYGIEPETFGGYCIEDNDGGSDYVVNGLTRDQVRELVEHGIVGKNIYDYDLAPKWELAIKYHWTQTFPAHQVVSVRHEYTPVVGFRFETPDEIAANHPDACVEEDYSENIMLLGEGYTPVRWIDYILTTANSWEGPIGDFSLRISPAVESAGERYRISFCWDGPVETNEAGEAVVHMADFTPDRDLNVLFTRQVQ